MRFLVKFACALVLATAGGCAAGGGFQGICGVQPIGQSEGGVPYFAISCEPQK